MKTMMALLVLLSLNCSHFAHGMEKHGSIGFNSRLPIEVKALIMVYAARDTKPSDLRLICKEWTKELDRGKDEKKVASYQNIGHKMKDCIHAWYGVTGHEEILKKFLNGKLVYRPNKNNNDGMIEFKISDLANPFAGTFDLSKCGDTGKNLAIMTGFRKEKIEENKNKVEVWITSRFLVERFRESNAKHFEPILGNWDGEKAPIGLFYTRGNWDRLAQYECVTNKTLNQISGKNLFENRSDQKYIKFVKLFNLIIHIAFLSSEIVPNVNPNCLSSWKCFNFKLD